MVIQGTAGIGKSYLISCLKSALQTPCEQSRCVLLLLAPIGVATFNIHAFIIHSALRIPIGEMQPLESQSLSKLQEELQHICYILINEMSFIGPKMLTQIDACLHQAFPLQCTIPFGGFSRIILGDFGQLPPVKDIPMYEDSSVGTIFGVHLILLSRTKQFSDNKEIVLLKLPFGNSC